MKNSLVATLILFPFLSFCQQTAVDLKKIKTAEDAALFIKEHPQLHAEIVDVQPATDSSEAAKKLFAANKGSVVTDGDYTYKILDVTTSASMRVSYIYLDGSKLTLEQISDLRKKIIDRYKAGTPFINLVKEYTMDGNPDGDLGWFTEKMMVKEFTAAVKARKKGEIFTVDVPDKKWYYVTLKTVDDKEIKDLTVLKYKNN